MTVVGETIGTNSTAADRGEPLRLGEVLPDFRSEIEIPTRVLVLGMAQNDGTILAAELYPVAEACGQTADQVRSCLRRLVSEGLFTRRGEGRDAEFRATEAGMRALGATIERTRLAYAQDAAGKGWDRKWRLIAFAIPESKRTARDAFRDYLIDLGGAAIQNGLYDQEILMKTDALSTISVDVGGSAMIAAPHWVSWPSDQRVSRTQNDVGWAVAPSTRASVTSEGVVTGSQAGPGVVWLRAQSAAPAGYAMWTPFRLRGDSVELTVTTPPPVALQVSDIVVRNASTDQVVALPITTAGEYVIDAVVIGTPTWTRID